MVFRGGLPCLEKWTLGSHPGTFSRGRTSGGQFRERGQGPLGGAGFGQWSDDNALTLVTYTCQLFGRTGLPSRRPARLVAGTIPRSQARGRLHRRGRCLEVSAPT